MYSIIAYSILHSAVVFKDLGGFTWKIPLGLLPAPTPNGTRSKLYKVRGEPNVDLLGLEYITMVIRTRTTKSYGMKKVKLLFAVRLYINLRGITRRI